MMRRVDDDPALTPQPETIVDTVFGQGFGMTPEALEDARARAEAKAQASSFNISDMQTIPEPEVTKEAEVVEKKPEKKKRCSLRPIESVVTKKKK